MPSALDVTDQRFGKLVAKYKSGKANSGRNAWFCECDCGNTKKVDIAYLRNGETRSCGCLCSNRGGISNRRMYSVWKGMIDRCFNPDNKSYSYYGGRGISVCDRWADSPQNFIEDMGKRPSKKHSMDRIDVDGNYSPTNCQWATRSEQALNRRSTVWLTYDGKTLSMSQWAKKLGVPQKRLCDRKTAGFSDREILTGEREGVVYPHKNFVEEEWVEPIEEYFKGLILVSSEGRAYKYPRVSSGKRFKGGYTWGALTGEGYRLLNMKQDGTPLFRNLHAMVASAFIDSSGYDRGLVVHHIDGNRENNHVNNLCFCTYSHNGLMRYKDD